MFKKSNLRKYLQTYAELEATIEPPTDKQYAAAIVVPACGETHAFLDLWQTSLRTHESRPALVVLVVNGDENTAAEYADANQRLIDNVLSRGAVRLTCVVPSYLVTYAGFDVLLINRANAPHLLPKKCGVGLARKLGGDVVCAWHERGAVFSPWWMSTDADVELPCDIVERLCTMPQASGVACLPFEHVAGTDPRVADATWAVELELRYHALGLAYAGSNYAWPALGSCLAIQVDTYAAVRGFPKRQAGEDHYLLQKAAKLAKVSFATGAPIRIYARRSARTPFGTGRSVEELLQGEVLTLTLRHPECYTGLGRVITKLSDLGARGDWLEFSVWLRQEVPPSLPLATVLEGIGALEAWLHTCQLNLSAQTRTRRLNEWFDGLRQIQFLRGLEIARPGLPFDQALRTATFTRGNFTQPGPAVLNAESVWQAAANGLRSLQPASASSAVRFGI